MKMSTMVLLENFPKCIVLIFFFFMLMTKDWNQTTAISIDSF
jgi:hypothetical protein